MQEGRTGSRVELFARIRRDLRVEGASIRDLGRSDHRRINDRIRTIGQAFAAGRSFKAGILVECQEAPCQVWRNPRLRR